MAEANDKYGRIYQNLVDAGCNQKTIQRCMKLAQENNVEALLSQLYVYARQCRLKSGTAKGAWILKRW